MKVLRKIFFLFILIPVGLYVLAGCLTWREGTQSERTGPDRVLWAWERPEDLRFIDAERIGIAFLSSTILISGTEVIVSPRMQPLYLPQNPWLVAVARIESDRERPPQLSVSQSTRTLKELVQMAHMPGLSGIQIDFDATVSQREFYRNLIIDLKEEIPSSLELSITALTSWCWSDDWIQDLPVDDAVPMLFRMGPESESMRRRIQKREVFPVEICRGSLGISTDEMLYPAAEYGRTYIFHPRSWTPEALESVMEQLDR